MKTNYTIKNFRVFDKKGSLVEFSPLTFLVGCNSSGKSSIVKSLFLLKSFLSQKFDKSHPIIGSVIDFTSKPIDSLGGFSNVVRHSIGKKMISLSFDSYSFYCDDDITTTITLGEGELGNAVVIGFEMVNSNGAVIIQEGYSFHKGSESSSVLRSQQNGILFLRDAFKKYLIASKVCLMTNNVKSALEDGAPFFSDELMKPIFQEVIGALPDDHLSICSVDYLSEAVSRDRYCPRDYSKVIQAVDKFLETGILTYYPLFDDLKEMKEPNQLRSFLISKAMENGRDEYREALLVAIDRIYAQYCAEGDCDFLSYYRRLEEKEILSFLSIDTKMVKTPGLLEGNMVDNPYGTNSIVSIMYDMKKHEDGDADWLDFEPDGYFLIHDTMAWLCKNNPYTEVVGGEGGKPITIHPLYSQFFMDYVNRIISEVVSNDITEGLEYVSSSRIQVRRLYPLEDRVEFSDVVRKYFDARTKYLTLEPPIVLCVADSDGNGEHEVMASDYMPGTFMNKWLRRFNIADHLSMEVDRNGLGLLLKVFRSEKANKGILLADLGYGITQVFSILLQIEGMILSGLFNKFCDKVPSGFERSHGKIVLLPGYSDTPLSPRTISIEEPEIHLHPKYQSLLAEMIYEAYKEYNIQFIIETHSEYLLRKVQTLIGAKKLSSEEVSMIYVEDDIEVKKGAPKVRRIPIKKDGRLAEPFGPGFYDEADNLSLELFTNMGK